MDEFTEALQEYLLLIRQRREGFHRHIQETGELMLRLYPFGGGEIRKQAAKGKGEK